MAKSKKMKELKQKLETNKKVAQEKAIVGLNRINENKIVSVALEENLVAKIDRGTYFVSSEEIKELVKDLFYTKVELKENSIIDLNSICDVCYKLNYKGIKDNEALFQLC